MTPDEWKAKHAPLNGPRQVGIKLKDIEIGHRFRYCWASRHLTPYMDVADMGCGCGYGSSILASTGTSVVGVDFSKEAIDYAKKHWQQARYAVGDVTDELFHPRELDAIVAFEVLEHLQDHDKAIGSWARALRFGGFLLVSIPLNRKGTDRSAESDNWHVKDWTVDELVDLLTAKGLTIDSIEYQRDIVSVDNKDRNPSQALIRASRPKLPGMWTVAMDVDAVLANYTLGYLSVDILGNPIDGAGDFLSSISEMAEVIIYTTRSTPSVNAHHFPSGCSPGNMRFHLYKVLKRWLNMNRLGYDSIYVGDGKPRADVYFDDHAIYVNPLGTYKGYDKVGYDEALKEMRKRHAGRHQRKEPKNGGDS